MPLVLVVGVAALLGLLVGRVSAWRNPVIAQWAAHPWWWFFASQALAVIALLGLPAQRVLIACVLIIALPSAVQGLRIAALHSSARYWLVVGLGLAFVLAPRLLKSALGLPAPSSLFNSPIVLLPWMLATYVAMRFGAVRPEVPPLRLANDDPLLVTAIESAQGSTARFRELLDGAHKVAHVKTALVTSSGEVEHLWAELLERHGDQLEVRLITPPITHTGTLERLHTLTMDQLTDWQVELADGQLVGGFTMRAMFTRAREQGLVLPTELRELERRYGTQDGDDRL